MFVAQPLPPIKEGIIANPQAENGYTKIANEIMEALAKIRISGEERQVLDVIIRKTYGYNKKKDWISISQFVLATGLPKSSICRAINKLLTKNIIYKKVNAIDKKVNDIPLSYSFCKDFDKWKPLPKKITIYKNVNPHLQKCDIQKKVLQKTLLQKIMP